MADAQSQPDALALADSVKFAIQHRDEEIKRLNGQLQNIGEVMKLVLNHLRRSESTSSDVVGIPKWVLKQLKDATQTTEQNDD